MGPFPFSRRSVTACLAVLAVSTFWSQFALAQDPARLLGLRYKAYDTHTRVVLDLDRAVRQKNFTLSSPSRIVVDLPDTQVARELASSFGSDPLLKGLRSGVREGEDLRLVIETRAAAEAKTTYLEATAGNHFRIVLDIAPIGGQQALAKATQTVVTRPAKAVAQRPPDEIATPRLEDIVVAIDAGHGGNDPGAVGNHKTFEKDVVLAIAKRLHRMLSGVSGIKPVLVRENDEYLGLKDRVRITRESQADLMISLHADAFDQESASGSSVYVLSNQGASAAARRFLAAKQDNRVGGLHLSEQSDALAKILVDLSQSASRETSVGVAESVLRRIGKVNKLHKKTVERAGFVVLKAPDVPSILVEVGFISNPKEERRLKTTSYQERVAAAIGNGVIDHFKSNPPFGTAFYRRYRVDVASN